MVTPSAALHSHDLNVSSRSRTCCYRKSLRNSRIPFNVGNVADKARQFMKNNPDKLLKETAHRRKILIFYRLDSRMWKCLELDTQKVLLMRKLEHVHRNGLLRAIQQSSYPVSRNLQDLRDVTEHGRFWCMLLQKDRNWLIWMVYQMEIVEEVQSTWCATCFIAQRPELPSCIRCLPPMQSQQEMQRAGFRALADKTGEQLNVVTQSVTKRYWTATMVQNSAFL